MQHKCSKRKPLWLVFASLFVVASAAAAAPPSITTQMYDNSHDGWNPNETQLTIANVKTNFQLLFKDSTDGGTYSQPLYVPALSMGSLGTHNVIFVATENNTVFAFDADKAGPPLWSTNLTPSGETLQVANDYENTRIPQIGITGTPVIDPVGGTIYAVAASKTTSTPVVFHQRLHSLDLTNGKERANGPVDIVAKFPGTGGTQDGNGNVVFDPLVEFDRAGLTLFGNNVYIPCSSHEDNGLYQGWVIAYNKTSLAQAAVFNDSPNLASGVGGGSIWQAAVGMVADDASIYALSANGPFDSNNDYGDTALRLSPDLNLVDSFTPCNQQELDDLDVDLASGAPMILPDQSSGPTKLITFSGKEGSIYLLDRTAMGGYMPTTVADDVPCTDNVVQKLWRVLGTTPQSGDSDRNAYWGAPSYFSDSSGHQYVYYTGDYSPIIEYDLANGSLTPGTAPSGSPNQTASSEYNFAHGGTLAAISSNGGDPTTAVLWAIRHPLPPAHGNGTLTLDAYSATDLTNQLVFDVRAGSWTYQNDAFLIPTVANGKVYVSSSGELDVFGVSSVTPVPGSIRLSRLHLNFGKVAETSMKSETFKIRNAGKGDLHVTVGTLTAPFQVQGGGSLTLTKGQVAVVTVIFMPTTSGKVSQTLTVTSDDPKHPSKTVTASGTGK